MCRSIWSLLVEVQGRTKSMVLRAEELDRNPEIFHPTLIEQRNAHDHIMRAQAAKYGMKEFNTPEDREAYIDNSLDKALGHEYRGFFDIADWLGILYRERMSDIMSKYADECIDAAIPNYSSVIVPSLARFHREVERIRARKDIASGDDILSQVKEYTQLLDRFDTYLLEIVDAKPSLDERQRRLRRSGLKSALYQLFLLVVAASLGALATWLLQIRLGRPH